MSEPPKTDFSSAEQVYALHNHHTSNAIEARQTAMGVHDIRRLGQLAGAVAELDMHHWAAEAHEDPAHEDAQNYLSEAAKLASGIHGVANIISQGDALVAQGILEQTNNLIRAAFEQFGDDWHHEALKEHIGRGY
jgi:hypothetical protein